MTVGFASWLDEDTDFFRLSKGKVVNWSRQPVPDCRGTGVRPTLTTSTSTSFFSSTAGVSSSRNQLERRERVVKLARPVLGRQCAAGLHKTVNPHGRQSDLLKLVNNIPPAPLRAEGPGRRTEKSKGPWERHFQVHSDTSRRTTFVFNSARPAASFQKSSPSEGERSSDLA